jgi:thioesterase domain-containing protein
LIQNGRSGTLPLFCVPGAGAGVTSFFDLSQELFSNLPVYGLQPRGLDGILVPHIDVPSAARAYIKAIREVSPTGPYRLLGHSFGGWVVFEMALQLIASGEQIDTLIILDSEAPSVQGNKKQRYTRVGMLLELVKLYELSINRTMALTADDFSMIDNEQQLNLLLSRLIEVKLMPPRTSIETLRGIVRVFETNLNTDYMPTDQCPGLLHLVGVANTEGDNLDKDKNYQKLIKQWQQHAPETIFWEGPGNHMALLSPPHVLKLAERLKPLLKMG